MSPFQFKNEQPLPAKFWNEKGEMQRPQSAFRDFISSKPGSRFPPELDRYHLYVSYACPWGTYYPSSSLTSLSASLKISLTRDHLS
jgi:glutathionyl-hydroquinone reductase